MLFCARNHIFFLVFSFLLIIYLQINYSQSNWINTNYDQNNTIYNNINNISNKFGGNFEKNSIPMPPGFQSNISGITSNNSTTNKHQTTECIN